MKYENKTLWGIHGGRTGDADSLFLKKKCIAIGWDKMPNLAEQQGSNAKCKDFTKR